jgi:hypothetical protein
VIMDNNQIMIPGNMYQTWLKDASSLVSKRCKVNSVCLLEELTLISWSLETCVLMHCTNIRNNTCRILILFGQPR